MSASLNLDHSRGCLALGALTFDTLLDLCRGRFGPSDTACPLCGPDCEAAANRKRPVLRIWLADGFATYNCARCASHGYAHADGARRRARPRRPSNGTPSNPTLDVGKRDFGLARWNETAALEGTIAERFLVNTRNISPPPHGWPLSLRFHPGMPAMIAAVSGAEQIVAVQITRLDPLTANKAAISQPRKTYGRMDDGAVRLAPAIGDTLALAEGVETALSFTELTGIVCWAVLGKARFAKVDIPAHVRHLHLCADTDSVDVCEEAKRHYERRGLDVAVHTPKAGKDFNDELIAQRRSAA
jgi:putative DNA primase/helicase